MAIGSDVKEITYNHPTQGTGTIYPKNGEESTINPGGLRRTSDTSGVDGAGNTIATLTAERWSFEVTCAYNDNKQTDSDKLTALAADPEEADWTITFHDGRIYVGKGQIVDGLSFNGFNATFPLKLEGGGKLSKLV